ncbi:MAG: hypothetical protein WC729_09310 [Sphingomonas sp.]|jgi:hypothetical protein|uniref:hypothetical protein n=1 Tax=Sphingomonas sp. TaxID=28214 RepID=UPI00356AD288
MAEPSPVEGVDDKDLVQAAATLLTMPNTRADDPDRFAQAIRALVERRAQNAWPGEAADHEVAAFVMVARPREHQATFSSAPIADPAATTKPLLGNVLLLTRDGAHGQIFPMPCEPDGLLDWLSDKGFGESPLVIAYRPTAKMTVRTAGVQAAITREDPIRSVPPVATVEALREALERFRLDQLLTPGHCENGVWEPKRAIAYVPGARPELAIQNGLSRHLSSWFQGVIKVVCEHKTNIGRIDVKLLTNANGQPLAYWAILELKVIRTFAHATGKTKPGDINRSENIEAVKKGLRQAWGYQKNSKTEHGLLEVYDMRRDKSDDLFGDADVLKQLARLSPKPEYNVRPMYGSPEDARLAGESGV